MMDVKSMLQCAGMGILGGLGAATMHSGFEHMWYHTLSYLDRKGLIQRLAPSINVTMTQYRKESFWAVAIWPVPISACAFAYR